MENTTYAVDCFLERHKLGIRVHVSVLPEIEEFFQQWGGGEKIQAQNGRLWKTMTPDSPPLKFWSLEHRITDPTYDLQKTGVEIADRNGILNIGFLRLVGASEPGGRDFLLDSVISAPELRILGSKITKAGEKFYIDYIRRVNVRVFVGVVDQTRITV